MNNKSKAVAAASGVLAVGLLTYGLTGTTEELDPEIDYSETHTLFISLAYGPCGGNEALPEQSKGAKGLAKAPGIVRCRANSQTEICLAYWVPNDIEDPPHSILGTEYLVAPLTTKLAPEGLEIISQPQAVDMVWCNEGIQTIAGFVQINSAPSGEEPVWSDEYLGICKGSPGRPIVEICRCSSHQCVSNISGATMGGNEWLDTLCAEVTDHPACIGNDI
jgi:hypothetical protein